MLKSMTAYGRAVSDNGKRSVCVEIKSVNNRYLDCSVKLPRLFSFLEDKVKARVTSRGIMRGKVDVFISIEITDASDVSIALNRGYAESYIKALRELSSEFSLPDDITTSRVAQNKDVFIFGASDGTEDAEREWLSLQPALDEALDMFIAARELEGSRLKDDIASKKRRAQELAALIPPLSEDDTKAQFEKMRARLTSLFSETVPGVEVDQSKLMTECALFADRIAIDEEIVRLDSHFRTFDSMLATDEPVGRKLDFLLQEINRETNTIGSKVCDARIAKLVIEIKSELEKIREQIQNIE